MEIVQLKLFAPTPRAVNPDVADVGLVMVPEPEINVHKPVPVTGTFPARVAVVAHTDWSGPAAAIVGAVTTVIITSSVEGAQGAFDIVQRKVFAPTPRAVRPEVGDVGVVMVPEPEINVHKPVPAKGVFPARVAVVAHTVWSGPAAAVVGGGRTLTLTFIASPTQPLAVGTTL